MVGNKRYYYLKLKEKLEQYYEEEKWWLYTEIYT